MAGELGVIIMNIHHSISLIFFMAAASGLLGGERVHTITDRDDRTIEVIFYNKTEGGIHVIRTDGHDFVIKLDTLHPASQQIIQSWAPNYPLRSIDNVRTDYAFACYSGNGARKDLKRAFQVFEKSAQNGDSSAQGMLGLMYLDGEGTAVNKVLGARWLERSARQGATVSEGELGRLYMDGEGVQRNYTTAYMYLNRAAQKGYAPAQCNLGILYYFGEGVRQDRAKALELLRKAAAAGHDGASRVLARIASDSRQPGVAAPGAVGSYATTAYVTKVDSDEDDVVILENGAFVKITWGYLGYVGWRKDAVLFKEGLQWKIWIEGKKAFNCELLKAPQLRGQGAQVVHISEVLGNGSIIKMLDGSLFEVNSLNTIDTVLWLGVSGGLLINESKLINFDEGELIEVTRLK